VSRVGIEPTTPRVINLWQVFRSREIGCVSRPARVDEASELPHSALLFVERDSVLLTSCTHDAALVLLAGDGQRERIVVAPEAPGRRMTKGRHARQEILDGLEIPDVTRARTSEREGEGRPRAANRIRQRRRSEAQRFPCAQERALAAQLVTLRLPSKLRQAVLVAARKHGRQGAGLGEADVRGGRSFPGLDGAELDRVEHEHV
jgi:hypothetical protein